MIRLTWSRSPSGATAKDERLTHLVVRSGQGFRLFQAQPGSSRFVSADRAYPDAESAMLAAEDVTPPDDPEAA